ncbi:homocysteine S-methyltransferase family protein [Nitriliruptor alkaliphilus]|uniref:homocysteine S-methyltransferase family protein n=1 Tax=Nitriliruptor alkaliphilus TaxID=427918 RepID=UPI000696A9F1|nr:homocysteine S-methyltransferase family protein [Nitriliruptor alkaliphilus]
MLPPLDAHPFLDALRRRVMVLDGAMGTSLQDADLTADDFGSSDLEGCNEILVDTRPDVVEAVHRSFLEVGCDAVETDTFGGAPWVLDEYGLGDRTEELNEKAALLARAAADAYSTPDRPRFVIGSIGPGTRSPTLSLGKDPATTKDFIDVPTMEDGYRRQIRALLDGGTDVIWIETSFDLLQIKAAVAAANDVFEERGSRVPLAVQFTIEKDINTMLLGTEPLAALAALDPLSLDLLGMNCATGPEDMREHVRTLSRASRLPLSVLPNAGMPELIDGATVYPLDPAGLAQAQREFVTDLGVSIVGGCCGTTPDHIAAVVEAVADLAPRPRVLDRPDQAKPGFAGSLVLPDASGGRPMEGPGGAPAPTPVTVEYRPSLASLYSAVPLEQDTAFLAIGERANANGSKAFREILLAEDWDGTVALAKSQTREGAHVLDVCVDYVGREGAPDMIEVVDRYATQSTLPLVIDSTQSDVVEAALLRLGGRAVINSVNLEDGRNKADLLLPLAKRYGAAVVVLAIDEEGQARTADWKVQVSQRVAEIAIDEFGLEPQDLIFDCLTFPLGSGQEDLRRDALETLEAIERISQLIPGCGTTLGVSNVSFGLSAAARQVLNSVFLKEAVDRGLTSAIVHPGKILPLHRIPDEQVATALDLVHDRRGEAGTSEGAATQGAKYDPLHHFMALFEGEVEQDDREELASLPIDQRLHRRIVDGEREGLEADLDEALADTPPLDIINTHLLGGMKEVGQLFASGAMQLPFVLQSAEAMKTAVAYLEPHIEASGGGSSNKGSIVLATVKGDVHDIGKNLVDIILRNNGYEVHNLGIKQPIDTILHAAEEHGVDAIGMSGLLVKSTVIMKDNLEEMNVRGLARYPVLLGGAALTRGYVEDDLRAIYEGQVFYCKDAFEGLSVLDTVMAGDDPAAEIPEGFGERRERRKPTRQRAPEAPPAVDAQGRPRSTVATDVDVPAPPFWGQRVVRGVPVDEVAPLLNEVALFRNQWGFGPGDGSPDEYAQLLEEKARPVLREWLARAKAEKVITPEVVYGYYPANGDGDDLVVWHPDAPLQRELVRFAFPRQDRGRFLNIGDFFRPVDSGEVDVLGVQVVTMGHRISEVAQDLFAQDRYQDYLFAHGFGVEMAEALAELWHRRIREELGIAGHDGPTPQDWFRQGYRGSRYSFGYAACPDLEMQEQLFELVDPSQIGVELTEEFMLHPEQSTSAIVVHHPEAKYFNAR